jgi:hypothetical protein
MQLITHTASSSSRTDFSSDEEFNDWLQLIRSEYAEMPGLHLTARQAQRLWGLDAPRCQALLDALESARYLKRIGDQEVYVRVLGCSEG